MNKKMIFKDEQIPINEVTTQIKNFSFNQNNEENKKNFNFINSNQSHNLNSDIVISNTP